MLEKYSKRSDRSLLKLAKLSKIGLKDAYIIEKKSGMPNHFNVPKPKIPIIKIKKEVLNGKPRRFV